MSRFEDFNVAEVQQLYATLNQSCDEGTLFPPGHGNLVAGLRDECCSALTKVVGPDLVDPADLKAGDQIIVTLNHDGDIGTKDRGGVFDCVFRKLQEPGDNMGQRERTKYMLIAHGSSSTVTYGFHDWMIKSIERVP